MSKDKKEIIDNEDGTMAEFLKTPCKITAARSPSPRATSTSRDMPSYENHFARRQRGTTFISAS